MRGGNLYLSYLIGTQLVSTFIENLDVALIDGVSDGDRIADRFSVWNEELGEGSRLGRCHGILQDSSRARPTLKQCYVLFSQRFSTYAKNSQ